MLTQSRPHIIKKTFDAIKGAKNVVVHLYNSTSFAQRQQVFRMSEDEIVDIAVSGAKLFDEYAAKMPETNFRFEYSPRASPARRWSSPCGSATPSSTCGSPGRSGR